MAFSETPLTGITGVFFVFPMVVFGLRTTLLAITRGFPIGAVGGALTTRATVSWLNFVAAGGRGAPPSPPPRSNPLSPTPPPRLLFYPSFLPANETGPPRGDPEPPHAPLC